MNDVPPARLEPGVYIIVFPLQLKLPDNPGGGVIEKADCADVWFMDSLKVTVIWVVIGTFVPVGVFPITVGGDVSETDAVVNGHE